jgi:hypothetical protein
MPPAGSGSSQRQRHPSAVRRRTSPWFQLGLAAILALVVGVGVYVAVRVSGSSAPPLGAVRVTVRPPVEAQIFVDGRLHGAMDAGRSYEARGLLQGKHRIEARGPGFRPVEQVVEVLAGETTALQLSVQKR